MQYRERRVAASTSNRRRRCIDGLGRPGQCRDLRHGDEPAGNRGRQKLFLRWGALLWRQARRCRVHRRLHAPWVPGGARIETRARRTRRIHPHRAVRPHGRVGRIGPRAEQQQQHDDPGHAGERVKCGVVHLAGHCGDSTVDCTESFSEAAARARCLSRYADEGIVGRKHREPVIETLSARNWVSQAQSRGANQTSAHAVMPHQTLGGG